MHSPCSTSFIWGGNWEGWKWWPRGGSGCRGCARTSRSIFHFSLASIVTSLPPLPPSLKTPFFYLLSLSISHFSPSRSLSLSCIVSFMSVSFLRDRYIPRPSSSRTRDYNLFVNNLISFESLFISEFLQFFLREGPQKFFFRIAILYPTG